MNSFLLGVALNSIIYPFSEKNDRQATVLFDAKESVLSKTFLRRFRLSRTLAEQKGNVIVKRAQINN